MMQDARVAIIGAGLSGLYAAFELERHGMRDYVLLEAREMPGGRIASVAVSGSSNIDRFDLGPTWFWPEMQPQLQALQQQLGIECFAQFDTGDMLVERSLQEGPLRVRGYVHSPTSMRMVGGMMSIIERLRDRIDVSRLVTGQVVRQMCMTDQGIDITCEDPFAQSRAWRVEQVLLALPPRLAVRAIEFMPALPPALAAAWQATATWMAPHAKYLATYDHVFWREQGLSGAARSALGPLGEIHDASVPGGSAALFGFFAVPARMRQGMAEATLKQYCRAQLVRLFGEAAATPTAEMLKDWSQDPYTATPEDQRADGHHAQAPSSAPAAGPWAGRLVGIASEWSPQFPGYVAGAVEAAHLGVQAWLAQTEGVR